MSDIPSKSPPVAKQMIVNGELVPFEAASVHLMSPAMRYGLNIFEGLRGYWNARDEELHVFRLAEHMVRFEQSMRLLRFEPKFEVTQINDAILHLLRSDTHRADCHIRATAYLDGFGEHHVPGPVSWMVYAGPRPRSEKTKTGTRVQVSTWQRIPDNAMPPRIKCGANYVNARLARHEARSNGFDDAVMLNASGKIAEGPGACLFIVRRGRLVTPDVTSGILESITRDTIIDLAGELGLTVEARSVDRTELYTADEMFFAGSAAEVLPVISVDGLGVGNGKPGPATQALQSAYFSAVAGDSHVSKGWLTPVYGAEGAVA